MKYPEEVKSIPKHAKEISPMFLAKHIRDDVEGFTTPVFVTSTASIIHVFAVSEEIGIWKYTYRQKEMLC